MLIWFIKIPQSNFHIYAVHSSKFKAKYQISLVKITLCTYRIKSSPILVFMFPLTRLSQIICWWLFVYKYEIDGWVSISTKIIGNAVKTCIVRNFYGNSVSVRNKKQELEINFPLLEVSIVGRLRRNRSLLHAAHAALFSFLSFAVRSSFSAVSKLINKQKMFAELFTNCTFYVHDENDFDPDSEIKSFSCARTVLQRIRKCFVFVGIFITLSVDLVCTFYMCCKRTHGNKNKITIVYFSLLLFSF